MPKFIPKFNKDLKKRNEFQLGGSFTPSKQPVIFSLVIFSSPFLSSLPTPIPLKNYDLSRIHNGARFLF